MRDISAGEELTSDYALFDDYDGTMERRCGTPSCRGTVSGRDWQRPDLQRKYGSYFSAYLLRRDVGKDSPDLRLRTCTRDDRRARSAWALSVAKRRRPGWRP